MRSDEGEAAAAEISHQTRVSQQQALGRSFVSRKSLLDSTIEWEKDAFARGIATAIAGSCGVGKLEAALRFIVEYQKSSAHRMVGVERVHTIAQLGPMIPILREQLRRLLPPEHNSEVVADAAVRVAISHYLVPSDDSDQFLAQLRCAVGIPECQPAQSYSFGAQSVKAVDTLGRCTDESGGRGDAHYSPTQHHVVGGDQRDRAGGRRARRQ
jgi:hypothetical protein